jgi:SAM-dependent methyltransferase
MLVVKLTLRCGAVWWQWGKIDATIAEHGTSRHLPTPYPHAIHESRRNQRPMGIHRILEPELMDTSAEAECYNAMDHGDVNRRFVADLIAAIEPHFPVSRLLDLGTGTALIPIELCRQHADVSVVGSDLAERMLEVGRANARDAKLEDRIELVHSDAKGLAFTDNQFPLVISNSIVHHIPKPLSVLHEAERVASEAIFFRDLMRPGSESQLNELVTRYAGEESDHGRSMFHDSLHAALSLEEIRELVSALGFSPETVEATSDRHWTWFALLC